jgi:hypothetical protein
LRTTFRNVRTARLRTVAELDFRRAGFAALRRTTFARAFFFFAAGRRLAGRLRAAGAGARFDFAAFDFAGFAFAGLVAAADPPEMAASRRRVISSGEPSALTVRSNPASE